MDTITAQTFLQSMFKKTSNHDQVCLLLWKDHYYIGFYQPLFLSTFHTHQPVYLLKTVTISQSEYQELLHDLPTICISDQIRLFNPDHAHVMTLTRNGFSPLTEEDTLTVSSALRYVSNIGSELVYQTA